MKRSPEQIWKEVEAERKKLDEMKAKGYLGSQLYDVMEKIFRLMKEEEEISKNVHKYFF